MTEDIRQDINLLQKEIKAVLEGLSGDPQFSRSSPRASHEYVTDRFEHLASVGISFFLQFDHNPNRLISQLCDTMRTLLNECLTLPRETGHSLPDEDVQKVLRMGEKNKWMAGLVNERLEGLRSRPG
jgi:hypothetical protein